METLMLVLLLLSAVLASSIIDQFAPKITLPLVQILCGIVIALLIPGQIDIPLDPSLFLVLFIAPIIYNESKMIDKNTLWAERKPVLLMAIGLVLVTSLIVGFVLNAFLPSISIAAAIALGAALSPTDASAILAITNQVKIPKKTENVIVLESILNDASGLVIFQFAIAAAMTDAAFHPATATATFLIMFVGGTLVGIIMGVLANAIVRYTRKIGLENTTFHVLFEVFMPFIIYLVANSLGLSAIMAVVAAGLVNIIAPRTIGPSVARMNIVSSSVWDVLSFTLNGTVFVLLGTQLPKVFVTQWGEDFISNGTLILLVIGLALLLILIRFAWVWAMDFIDFKKSAKHKKTPYAKDRLRNVLINALAGARGTVTLSVALSIDASIAQRDLMIFLAAGVIMITLLVSTFIVPLIAEKKKVDPIKVKDEKEARLELLRNVIADLQQAENETNSHALNVVISSYRDRIEFLQGKQGQKKGELAPELRRQAILFETEYVKRALSEEKIDENLGNRYLARLKSMERLIGSKHEKQKRTFNQFFAQAKAHIDNTIDDVMALFPAAAIKPEEAAYSQFVMEVHGNTIAFLKTLLKKKQYPNEMVVTLINEYQNEIDGLSRSGNNLLGLTSDEEQQQIIEARVLAAEIELSYIQAMYEEGRLSRKTVKRMRENVHIMQLDIEGKI